MTLKFDLGGSYGRAAGADDFSYRLDGGGTKAERGEPSWAVGSVYLVDAQQTTHHEYGWVNASFAVGQGRHHHRNARHPSDDGWHTQLIRNGWITCFATRYEKTDGGDWGNFLADLRAG